MRTRLRFKMSSCIAFALMCALAYAAEDTAPNRKASHSFDWMDREGLQAARETRTRLGHEHRQPGVGHGLYTDFHAAFIPLTQELDQKKQEQLVAAARKTGTQILIITSAKGAEWHGIQDGILVLPGTTTDQGYLIFQNTNSYGKSGSPSGVEFLKNVHPNLSRTNNILAGMEICNSGADIRLDNQGEVGLIRRKIVSNLHSFPDEFFAGPSLYPKEILAEWDRDIQGKALTGIGVNEVLSISIFKEAGIDPFEEAVINPYEVSFRNLVTHILAQDLTESSIRNALTNGHAFVAHDWLCDPAGFSFGAINNLGVFGMGDTAPLLGTTRVAGNTPVPAKLRLIHKGTVIQEITGTNLTFQAKEPGPYRLEAWLTLAGEDRPWIYSNPVYLKTPDAREVRPPSSTISDEVKVDKNLVYREGAEEDSGKHKLDVYHPNGVPSAPVLFFIHGGSWKSGDRSLYGALGNRYSQAGFVTVVPSYRLAPKHPHPAQIEDVAAAFTWTVQHISEYGGDTNRIYVAGHSAGGHLAALLALDESYLAAYQLSPKFIHGVLALSGVYNFTIGESQESVFGKDPEFRRKASPLFHVKAGAPPFLVTFCEWDYFSLPAQARQFHKALQKAGVKSELVLIPRESHISEIVNVWRTDDPTVTAALKFMK